MAQSKKKGKNVLAPATTSQQPTSIPIPFPSAMQIRPIKSNKGERVLTHTSFYNFPILHFLQLNAFFFETQMLPFSRQQNRDR
jgi:hypothetical protein